MYEDQHYTQQLSASFEISPQTAWRRLEWQHLSGSEDYNLHEHLVDGDHIKITATSGSEECVAYTHIMESHSGSLEYVVPDGAWQFDECSDMKVFKYVAPEN